MVIFLFEYSYGVMIFILCSNLYISRYREDCIKSLARSLAFAISVSTVSSLEHKASGAIFPSAGLMRYYNFDESNSIIARDLTGNHSMIVSNSWTPNGKINGAYTPNSNSYNSGFSGQGQVGLSLNFWLQKTNGWSPYMDIIGTGSAPSDSFYIDAAGGQGIYFWLAPNVVPTVQFPNDGNYHMLTLCLQNGQQRGYIDGAQEFVTSLPYSFSSNTVRLFGGLGGNPTPNVLNMDELGMWNRALSPSEVDALYNQGLGLAYTIPAPTSTSLAALGFGAMASRRRRKDN